jgi:dipeptidase E
MGIIVAIGGYEYESDEDEVIKTPISIDKEIIKLSKKDKPKVLFVPTASLDKKVYVNSIKKVYQDLLGAEFDSLLLHRGNLSKEEIQNKIDWADVIYVGGGNTLMMIKKWKLSGVDQMLLNAYDEGTVLCGVSAGSICWFEYGISDSLHFYDDKTTKYIKVSGLGILPGVHCPHFGSKLWDKGHRTTGMKEIMQRSEGECLAVPDGTALIFREDEISSIGRDGARKCYWENNIWQEDKI